MESVNVRLDVDVSKIDGYLDVILSDNCDDFYIDLVDTKAKLVIESNYSVTALISLGFIVYSEHTKEKVVTYLFDKKIPNIEKLSQTIKLHFDKEIELNKAISNKYDLVSNMKDQIKSSYIELDFYQ